MSEFAHLHVHSEYSLLDGLGRVDSLLKRAKELGMDSLALTDHGAMYAAIDFYVAAKDLEMKPIIGVEAYLAPGSRFDRKGRGEDRPYHLLLLAKDYSGYQNLVQLTSQANLEGFYYKPRIDREILAKHTEGLICLSGCASAEVPRMLMNGNPDGARRAAEEFRGLFGAENYYIELQRHDWPELELVNQQLIEMARELSIPLVATNDTHYVKKEDARFQDLLLCVQTGTTLDDPKRMRMRGDSYYLRGPDEMKALFADVPEAISNTLAIAEKCNLKLDFGRVQLPDFPIPEGHTPDTYLEKLCRDGLKWRYSHLTGEIDERLRYELGVIRQTGFALYILIVWDIVRFARERGIPFGPRGSAAGALVCFLLGISDVDPIANKLVFERFLNIERHEMPDIDMDFADDRREDMINYVTEKYGRDRVAQIITFGTLGAKAAIRDVGRAMGMAFGDVDRVAKLVPSLPLHITIKQAMEDQTALREMYENDDSVRQLIDSATGVEGVVRHASTHAAGVVISRDPLTEVAPLQMIAKGEGVMTQYHAGALQKIGLLKMDFLGLANLSILRRALVVIKQNRGLELDLRNLPQEDEKTFASLSRGETVGIFQLEGSGMTRYLVELKPTTVSDLCAMIALYRPGPMTNIPQYIARKHGEEPIEYPHPLLEETLRDTYGVLTYQDQVLQVLQRAGGYTLGQADIVRKAMSKKVRALMEKEQPRFVEGCLQKGLDEEEAKRIWELLEPFAGYGFNRSHAACYAQVAYQTAYLKTNFPAEYMEAVLSSAMGSTEKVTIAAAETRRLGIAVLGPDVNRSAVDFVIEADTRRQAIRFGLGAIKNVGESAVLPLIAARQKGGLFKSLDDFCSRVDTKSINRRVLESLVKAGALDSFGRRSQLLAVLDQIIGVAQQTQRAQEAGQASLFDFLPVDDSHSSIALPNVPDVQSKEKLAWEKELLGVYVSEHPLERVARALVGTVSVTCGDIDQDLVGQKVTVAGLLRSVRLLTTKKRDAMAAATLEDLTGSVEIVVFPRTYEKTKDLWQDDAIVLLDGKVDARDERIQVIVEAAEIYRIGDDVSDDLGVDQTEITDEAVSPQPIPIRPGVRVGRPEPASAGNRAWSGPAPLVAEIGATDGGMNGTATVEVYDVTNDAKNGNRAASDQATDSGAGSGVSGVRPGNGNAMAGGGGPNGATSGVPASASAGASANGRGGGRNGGSGARRVAVVFWRSSDQQGDVSRFQQLHDLVASHAGGNDSLAIRVTGADQLTVELEMPRLGLKYDGQFSRQIAQLLGEGALQVEGRG